MFLFYGAFLLIAPACCLVLLLFLGYGALGLREPGASLAPYLRGLGCVVLGLPLSNLLLLLVAGLLSGAFSALFPSPPAPAGVDPDAVPATSVEIGFAWLLILLALAWNALTLLFCLGRPFRGPGTTSFLP